MAECHTVSDGHGLTPGAFFNIRLTFHHLHSQAPSRPLRTTSTVVTTRALSETSALPSTMTVIKVSYLSLIKMSTSQTSHYLKLYLFEAVQQCHSGQPSSRCGYPETCLDLSPAWVAITTVLQPKEVHCISL